MSSGNLKLRIGIFACCVGLLAVCGKQPTATEHPRLTSGVVMRDVVFHSASFDRDMQYRVVLPTSVDATHKVGVVYLLHGGDGNFRDWTNYSDVARFAEQRSTAGHAGRRRFLLHEFRGKAAKSL